MRNVVALCDIPAGQVELHGDPTAVPPVPRAIRVWHSVRADGDTKTPQSRRTLALPIRCAVALRIHRTAPESRDGESRTLVECRRARVSVGSRDRTRLTQRASRLLQGHQGSQCGARPAGLDATRDAAQLRLAAVDAGVTLEDIARLVGHSSTRVTEVVYRKQIRPVIAEARPPWTRSSLALIGSHSQAHKVRGRRCYERRPRDLQVWSGANGIRTRDPLPVLRTFRDLEKQAPLAAADLSRISSFRTYRSFRGSRTVPGLPADRGCNRGRHACDIPDAARGSDICPWPGGYPQCCYGINGLHDRAMMQRYQDHNAAIEAYGLSETCKLE